MDVVQYFAVTVTICLKMCQ